MISHSKPDISLQEHAALREVLSSGQLVRGARTAQFERQCCEYLGCKRAFAVSSGTAALVAALTCLNLPPKSEIVLSCYQCGAVRDAVLSAGHVPVRCDIGNEWAMTVETASRVITQRTGAIIVTPVFGIRVPIEPYRALRLPVIVDACHRFCPDSPVDQGDITVYSFHATKCLATGEGGLVATSDPAMVSVMESLATIPGSPLKHGFSDVQAALGIAQLSRYASFLAKRKQIASAYLADFPSAVTSAAREIADHTIWFRFPLHVASGFAGVANEFARRGIAVRQGVDALIEGAANVPQATERLHTTVSVPIYPALSDADVQEVVKATLEVLG